MQYDSFVVLQESRIYLLLERLLICCKFLEELQSLVALVMKIQVLSLRVNGGRDVDGAVTDKDGRNGGSGGGEGSRVAIKGKDEGSVISKITELCLTVGNSTVK